MEAQDTREVIDDEVPGSEAGEETPRRDPVERALLIAVTLILAVFVATAGSLVLYVLSMRNAPRTEVESEINAGQVSVKEHPEVVENWARLALGYAKAERYDDALSTIRRGRNVKAAPILDLTEADILRLKHDSGAVSAYEHAIETAKTDHEQQLQALRQKKGVTVSLVSDIEFEARRGLVMALIDANRYKDAADQARTALAMDPADAELHATLGDVYVRLGRKSDARAEYRDALRYVPDLKQALAGMKRIGEGE